MNRAGEPSKHPSGLGRSDVSLGWGIEGALLSAACGTTVVVDVLTFTTTVVEACRRGIVVYPYQWPDDGAREMAHRLSARLAVSRDDQGEQHASLSPLSISHLKAGRRLVLPSPNGGAVSVAAASRADCVLAATLANASAVAEFVLRTEQLPINVIACGEVWPRGSFEYATEDLVGAGAVIAGLRGLTLSGEAVNARDHFLRAKDSLERELLGSKSGQRLIQRGFENDVRFSAQCNSAPVVPRLRNGEFVPA